MVVKYSAVQCDVLCCVAGEMLYDKSVGDSHIVNKYTSTSIHHNRGKEKKRKDRKREQKRMKIIY